MRVNVAVVLTLSLASLGPAAAGSPPATCARLLTDAEVKGAAGPGFKNVLSEASAGGESECDWLLQHPKNPKAIALRFSEVSAVAGLPALFETKASKAEQLHGSKRERLDGIGAQAAFIPGMKPGAMAVVVVQTAKGVAYLETDSLERAQVLRLAKAIVAP